MRFAMLIGTLAVAAGLLVVLAGSGSAAATVLCEEDKNPCPAAYPVGTEIAGELRPGEKTLFTGFGDSCKASNFTGKVTNAGGLTSTVTVALTSLSWSGCGRAKEVLELGSLELHYQGESGYVALGTLSGLKYKDGFCTYTVVTGSNAGLREPEGSSHARLDVETVATAPICTNQTWEAIFTLTAPSPLYASAS